MFCSLKLTARPDGFALFAEGQLTLENTLSDYNGFLTYSWQFYNVFSGYTNEMLDKAFARWSSTFGAPVQQEPVKQAKQKPIVPNIGGLPAADTTETDTNRFKALDDLIDSDPLRYQEELFKLSPSERAAYLAC